MVWSPGNRNWTPKQRKEWIGPECIRCGSTERLELDHILAHSLGGLNKKENSQTLCRTCNMRKFKEEEVTRKGTHFICVVCEKPFYRYPSQITKGKPTTCSRNCAARYFRDKGETVNCPICSNPFWRERWKIAKGFGLFCSKPCWVKSGMGKKPLLSKHNHTS